MKAFGKTMYENVTLNKPKVILTRSGNIRTLNEICSKVEYSDKSYLASVRPSERKGSQVNSIDDVNDFRLRGTETTLAKVEKYSSKKLSELWETVADIKHLLKYFYEEGDIDGISNTLKAISEIKTKK